MADDQSALTVKITADAGQATTAIADFDARLKALEASFVASTKAAGTATVAVTEHGAAHTRAAASVRHTRDEAHGAGDAMEYLGSHFRAASAGAEVLGLSVGEATAKLAAFGEVVEGVEKIFAPMMALIVGFQAALAGFDWIKEGVTAASSMESQLRSLKGAIDAQGESWSESQEAIETFVKQSALAAGLTSEQVLPALNDLVTMGNSVHDSLMIAGVAEELMRAKHISLSEATDALKAAELGRYRGLESLDGKVKDVVNTHGTYIDILRRVHTDSKNAESAEHDLSLELERLHAELAGVAETLGLKFIPMLVGFTETMIGIPKTAAITGEAIADVFKGIGLSIQGAGANLGDFARMMGRMGSGDIGGAQAAYNAMKADNGLFKSGLDLIGKGNALQEHNDATANGKAIVDKVIKDMQDDLEKRLSEGMTGPGLSFGDKPEKTGKTTGSSVTETYTDLDPFVQKTDAAAVAQQNLNDKLKALDTALNADRAAVQSATTVSAEAAAKRKLEADTLVELTAKHKLLNDAIYAENQAAPGLQAANAIAIANYQTLAAEVAAYDQTLRTQATPATIDQQNALAELRAKAEAAKTAIATTAAAITENTNNLRTNTAALIDNNKAKADHANLDAQDAVRRDAAAIAAQEAALKHLLEQQKKMHDEEVKYTSDFLDQIIVQHKSFADVLKGVYGDILKAFEQMVAKMIVESKLFGNVFGNLGGATGSSGGGLASMFGLGGASKATDVNLKQAAGKDIIPSTGVPVSAANVVGGNAAPLGGSSVSAGLTGQSRTVSDIAGIAGLAAGFSTGGVSGGLEAGLGTYALLHGLLTGGAAAGPVGLIAAGAVGLGSLLIHHDDPAKMPDKYNTDTYGQMLANAQGQTVTANGKQFSSADLAATGGKGDIAYLAAQIAAGNTSGLTADEIKEFTGASGITGGKDGNLTLSNGQTINWQTLATNMADAMSKVGAAASTIPTFTIARDYAMANGSVSSTGSSLATNGVVGGITVNITAGSVVGSNGMSELTKIIGRELYSASRGSSPALGRSTAYTRSGGGF